MAVVIFSLFSLSPFNSENCTSANIYFILQSEKKKKIPKLLQYKYAQLWKIVKVLQSKYFLSYSTSKYVPINVKPQYIRDFDKGIVCTSSGFCSFFQKSYF